MKDYLNQIIEKVIKNSRVKKIIFIILSLITFLSTFNIRSTFELILFGAFLLFILIFALIRRYLNNTISLIFEIVIVAFMLSMIIINYIYGSPFHYIYNQQVESRKIEKEQNKEAVNLLYLFGQEQYSKLIDTNEIDNKLIEWKIGALWNKCNSEELYNYVTHENKNIDQNYIRIVYLSSLFKEKKYRQIIEFYNEYEELIDDSFIRTIYCYSLLMNNETEKLRNTISQITILQCQNPEQLNFQTEFWLSLYEKSKQSDDQLAIIGLAEAYKFNSDYFNECLINEYNPVANWDLWIYSNHTSLINYINTNIESTLKNDQYSNYRNDIISFGERLGAKKVIEYDNDFKSSINPNEYLKFYNILNDAENLIAYVFLPNDGKMLYFTSNIDIMLEKNEGLVSNFSVFQFDGKINKKIFSTKEIWLLHNFEILTCQNKTFVKYLETSFDTLKIIDIDHKSLKCSEVNLTKELLNYHSNDVNILENDLGYIISWNAQVNDHNMANVEDKIDTTNYLQLGFSNSIEKYRTEYTNPVIELFQKEELLNLKLYKGRINNNIEGDLFKECLENKDMHYVRNNVDNLISNLFKINSFDISSSIVYFDDCKENNVTNMEVNGTSVLNREYFALLFDNTESSKEIIGVYRIENYGEENYEISDSILIDPE